MLGAPGFHCSACDHRLEPVLACDRRSGDRDLVRGWEGRGLGGLEDRGLVSARGLEDRDLVRGLEDRDLASVHGWEGHGLAGWEDHG